VDASNGELIWRFLAAPVERRILAYDQIESAWPVEGSILVDQDIAYFAAGRHTELDGGIYVYALDPMTGKMIWKTQPTGHRGTQTDILTRAEKGIYMWRWKIDPKGAGPGEPVFWKRRQHEKYLKKDEFHLVAGNTFKDRTWSHRTAWRYGRIRAQMLVLDRNGVAYGVDGFGLKKTYKKSMMRVGSGDYYLFARFKQVADEKADWAVQVPVRMRALVVAGGTVFAAGPPDKKDAVGGELWAFNKLDGKKLASLTLEAEPVYDGMAAARGRLYISLKNGKLACYGE